MNVFSNDKLYQNWEQCWDRRAEQWYVMKNGTMIKLNRHGYIYDSFDNNIIYNNNNINIRKYNRKKCNRIDKIMLNININSCNLQNKDTWWYNLQNMLSDYTAVIIVNIIVSITITNK